MASFPTSESEFDKDDRISFSKLDSKFIAVEEDGTEFEFDPKSRSWIPIDDEPLDDEDEVAAAQLSESASDSQNGNQAKKRKDPPSGERRPSKKAKPPPQPRQNTAVYVTGLPLDTTVDEVHDLFSRKGGVIAEEIDSGKPRIKMYNDEQGNFKGDALVVFFKPQSVEMAIMLLDDTDFRFSASGMSSGKMRVQAADSSYKKTNYDQDGAIVVPDREKQQKTGRDRQKIIRKTQKLDAKLADWSDDEPSSLPTEVASRWDKTVILRHMFTLAELEEDPAALLDIKEDIREECAKLGTVTNVVLFDQEPDGIVSVKFQKVEGAVGCIQLMNGRSFDGRVVEATISTGKERFKRSKQSEGSDEDDS